MRRKDSTTRPPAARPNPENERRARSGEVLVRLLGEELRRRLCVQEEIAHLLEVAQDDLLPSVGLRHHRRGRQQLHRVPQRRRVADLAEPSERFLIHAKSLDGGAHRENLHHLLRRVRKCPDDDQTVQKIDGNAVRRGHVRALDLADAAVGGEDDDGREGGFQRAVEVREALDVQHVNLVDEEDAGDDVRLTFLPPLGDFHVNLLANLRADLAGVAREERQETLRPAVDHVDLVQGDDVDNLLSLLKLALGALHEFGLRTHGVVVAAPGERPAQLGDPAADLIDRDDVAGADLLLVQGFDHLLPEVIHRLHLRCLQRELAHLWRRAGRRRPVDLDLDNLALDDLRLLLDLDADRLAERLGQGLGLGHLHREDLRAGHHGKGRLLAEGFGHAHRDGGLAGAGLPREEDRAAGDLTVANHLQDHARSFTRVDLAHHSLRHLPGLERIVETEAADVAVRADALDAREILDLRHLHALSSLGHLLSR
mmetsp:Transcript_3864/g.17004  ORF Transcript_3864/g.17004 Transcript_3864/m.17004 type:complete len:483 (-) Transcript_3864:42-1490(-)